MKAQRKESENSVAVWGRTLAQERARLNKSRHNIADRCGVSAAVVAEWEQGTAIPGGVQHVKLITMLPAMKKYQNLLPKAIATPSDAPALRAPLLAEAFATQEVATSAAFAATFGEALRRMRKQANVSVPEVAELCSVDISAVRFWETDKNAPVRENYDKLCALFPELKTAPQPDIRDIDKPAGATYTRAPTIAPPVLSVVQAAAPKTAPVAAQVAQAAEAFTQHFKRVEEARGALAQIAEERARVLAEWDAKVATAQTELTARERAQAEALAKLTALTTGS